jgi:hypothetical protein
MGLVRGVLTLVSIVVAILAYLQFSSDPVVPEGAEKQETAPSVMQPKWTSRLPTYFFSHGGVSTTLKQVCFLC